MVGSAVTSDSGAAIELLVASMLPANAVLECEEATVCILYHILSFVSGNIILCGVADNTMQPSPLAVCLCVL